MRKKLPKHLSYDYRLKMDDVPAAQNDRMPLKVVMPGIVLGFLMAVIGLVELAGGMYDPESLGYELDPNIRPPLFSHTSVDTAFIILGLGIIIGAVVSYIRYKKIFFNGKTFSVDMRGVFGENELFREFLRNYEGVRLRVEFFQFGILNKNKYIVELEHRDPQKTIPLYISTDGTGIYQIWYYYAKRLNMPTILDTDEGTVIRETGELDKNLKDYLDDRGLLEVYENSPKVPQDIVLVEKADRTIVKPRRVFWSILSLLGAFWLFFYLLVLAGAAYNFGRLVQLTGSVAQTSLFFALAVALAIFFIGLMFKKDKIVLKDGRLILVNKILFISRKEYADLNRIRDIQVVYDPSVDRYYLAVITDDSMLAFGKSVPMEALQWVRDFIIFRMIH